MDPPSFISLPPRDSQPLRSAMKHPSRPGTPQSSPPAGASLRSGSPFVPRASTSRSNLRSPSATTSALPAVSPLSVTSALPSLVPLPVQAGYAPKVSFDTFENPQASMFSYTLQVKTEGYKRTRSTRVFLCASSPDPSGTQALDWVLDSLAQDGDELIVFRGVDQDTLEKGHEACREDARELMRQIQGACVDYDASRKLSIVVEFIAGKTTDTIDRLIALYRPDSVIVGTRGQSGMRQALGAAFGSTGMGSVSKYCLSHSPVPVIVVRPESKVRKTLDKRRADPKRGKHFDDFPKSKTNPLLSGATRPSGQRGSGTGVPMTWTFTR